MPHPNNALPEWVKHLAGFLKSHKYVKTVYLNKDGEYHLHAVKGFEKVDVAEFLAEIDTYAKPGGPETPDLTVAGTDADKEPVNNPDEKIQF